MTIRNIDFLLCNDYCSYICRYAVITIKGNIMATINIRIDDNLKAKSYAALEELGVSPSDALRQTLEYVAQNHKLPFQSVLVNDEDRELLEIARQRLSSPQRVKVSLDDL